MSRFAHFNPEDPAGAMERLIDRADHAKAEARENPRSGDQLLDVISDICATGAGARLAFVLATADGKILVEKDAVGLPAFVSWAHAKAAGYPPRTWKTKEGAERFAATRWNSDREYCRAVETAV